MSTEVATRSDFDRVHVFSGDVSIDVYIILSLWDFGDSRHEFVPCC